MLLSTTKWTALGPAPIATPNVSLGFSAGRIEAAAPDPTNADTMYIGANGGGVWKTGVWNAAPQAPTWIPVSDDQPSLNFAGYHPLVVHPANHKLILGVVSGPGAGILKSTNAGLGWQLLANSLFEGAALGSIAVHPSNPNILYVSVWWGGAFAKPGVYKSVDGGVNWQNTTSFHAGAVSDVIVARFNPQHLFAGLVRGSQNAGVNTAGVYRSTDSGATWQLMNGLTNTIFLGNAVRLESASATGTVYVSLFEMDVNAKVSMLRFKTANGGQTWKKLAATPGKLEDRAWHVLLAVDPRNANHVFANDAYKLYESTDGGLTWVEAETIADDWVNMTFDANNNGVVTADRNVYRYSPKTKTWIGREGNLQVTQFYDITLDPQNPDRAYGVAQDHFDAGKFQGTILWDYMSPAGGETGKVLVAPKNSNTLYVSDPLDCVANLVRRSTNGGANWTTIYQNNSYQAEDYDLAYSVQKSFVMDPQNPKRLVIGLTQVFECQDATVANPAWSAISMVLSPSSAVGSQYITALAIAPSDSQTIYAATADGHVWTTTNGGGNWKQNDSGLFGTANTIFDMRIDPGDPKRVVTATGGPGGKNVWLLDPASGTWKNISGNLPTNLAVASVCVDWKKSQPIVYAGTARAVYRSIDSGANWQKFGLYLPNTVVNDLQIIPASHILAAGTFGRGVWEILLSTPKKTAGPAKPKKGKPLPKLPVAQPYRHACDLVVLPGRPPGQPLVQRRGGRKVPPEHR